MTSREAHAKDVYRKKDLDRCAYPYSLYTLSCDIWSSCAVVCINNLYQQNFFQH